MYGADFRTDEQKYADAVKKIQGFAEEMRPAIEALADAVKAVFEFILGLWHKMIRICAEAEMERAGWTPWVARLWCRFDSIDALMPWANRYFEGLSQ